jgi:hypothetical protein
VLDSACLASPTAAEGSAHELESVGTMPVLVVFFEAGVSRLVAISNTLYDGPHPPIPGPILRRVAAGLWPAGHGDVPPAFTEYLRYPCVADGCAARVALGFVPAYTTHDAVLEIGSVLRRRPARRIGEATA